MPEDRKIPLHDLLQEQINLAGQKPGSEEPDYERLFTLISNTYRKAEQYRKKARQNAGLMDDEMRGLHFDVEKEASARVEAETRLFDAIEALDSGFAIFDAEDKLVAYNAKYDDIYYTNTGNRVVRGMPFATISRAYLETAPESERGGLGLEEKLAQRMATHIEPDAPFERCATNGTWFLTSEQKTREGGIVSILTDISELKSREREMRENEKRTELYNNVIMELTRSKAVMIGDLDVALREVTEIASKLLNVERASIWLYDDGRSVMRCKNLYEKTPHAHNIGPELLVARYPKLFKIINTNRMVTSEDVDQDPRLSEVFSGFLKPKAIHSLIYAPVKGPGYAEGIVTLAHVGQGRKWDQTEVKFVSGLADVVGMALKANDRRRSRERMLGAIERAELANRSKSEFLANMSHELRTPLNSILGFAELLQMEPAVPFTPEQNQEYASDIYSSGRHLLDLINDILDISKIEAGRFELREEMVEVEEIISVCTRLISERARDQGLELSVDIPERLPMVWADKRALKQVLLNLLSNAVKFTPSGGKISVHAGIDPDGHFRLAVNDTGIGIEEVDIKKALLPFVQLDNEYTRRHEGTGLGLPLAKSLVDMHGGTIAIESTLSIGTSVVIQFPMNRIKTQQQSVREVS
jgi:signal transduction histidine kinase